jgi:hypothetical protein
MAPYAERPQVGQITFPAAFCHRDDVIGVPETPASGVQIQLAAQCCSLPHGNELESAVELNRVDSAHGTDAAVTGKDLLAHVAWIGSEPPFVNAGIRAECPSPLWHLCPAPPADSPAVNSAFLCSPDPAALFLPVGGHTAMLFRAFPDVAAAGARREVEYGTVDSLDLEGTVNHSLRNESYEAVGKHVLLAVKPQLHLSPQIALILGVGSEKSDHLIKIVGMSFDSIHLGALQEPEALKVKGALDNVVIKPGYMIGLAGVGCIALLLVFRQIHFGDYVLPRPALSHRSPFECSAEFTLLPFNCQL